MLLMLVSPVLECRWKVRERAGRLGLQVVMTLGSPVSEKLSAEHQAELRCHAVV